VEDLSILVHAFHQALTQDLQRGCTFSEMHLSDNPHTKLSQRITRQIFTLIAIFVV